ncbi:Ribosomal RNA small subunit methyltransferase NEP1 [Trichinella pseudospiralis]|uniref:18S rRNA (pseudouridine-N1)-methyltransferase n=1 Tax=Trichinella pseudospiralis TaxID=6337 RepID=A0A0V1IWX3_TRIPS|nr:Ribosomal RNA small subunit methyltransferase NEP1 [Trichinella pseudospiralis]KRZ09511.1 Ribosomal RNA small subunit methyltransferase NEP1 [Trichinella pseudospiralis]KRZ27225.1 Ribosomal RNA small subunit methyltransferase NEP1 [Trichinella pseudospiralis]
MANQPKRLKVRNDDPRKLFIILEDASLELAKVGKKVELLCSDKHRNFLSRRKDPLNYRPDITHQCLLMLLDSPLNKAGLLEIYIHTVKNVLIRVHPQTRIPRTFERFVGLMMQLLSKLSIRATGSPETLLKVIKNPVTNYLPVGCKVYATSFHAERLVNIREIVPQAEPVAIVIGALPHGSTLPEYSEEVLKISNYPLSAALTCAKVCTAFEENSKHLGQCLKLATGSPLSA